MISNKVGNGTLTGAAVALLTWALTYFIPAWHSGLPPAVGDLLPAAVGVIGYFAGGYLSTHRATVAEVERAIAEAEAVISADQHAKQGVKSA